MLIDPSTPRGNYKFAGIDLTAPHPFAAGHVLSDAEARGFNRFLVTTLGNSFGGFIRRGVDAANAERKAQFAAGTYTGPMIDGPLTKKGEPTSIPAPVTAADFTFDFQAKFDEMFADYSIGESNRGGGGSEPVSQLDKIVRQLATAKINELLKAKGKKIADVREAKRDDGTSVYTGLIAQYTERHFDALTAQAQAQIDALATIGTEDDDLLSEV